MTAHQHTLHHLHGQDAGGADGHGHDHDDARDHRHATTGGRVPRGHAHGHGHHHGHAHHHGAPGDHGRAFAIAIALNSIFVVVEFVYGYLANSTALMADAGHNLSDVLGLMLAWGAALLTKRQPDGRYTYGLRSTTILAALANAMLLILATGGIAWEAVLQLLHPGPVAGATVSVVAGVGIVVNGLSALLFMAGSKHDLNIRGAYLHLAADAAISLGVLVAGLVVMYTGWNWLDPVVSIAIVVLVLLGTWSLLREALRMMLAAVPDNVDAPQVGQFLRALPGVTDMHDLHIWSMSTTETALTAHLVIPAGYPGDGVMDDIARQLKQRFAIHHCTLQIEQGTTEHACCLHG